MQNRSEITIRSWKCCCWDRGCSPQDGIIETLSVCCGIFRENCDSECVIPVQWKTKTLYDVLGIWGAEGELKHLICVCVLVFCVLGCRVCVFRMIFPRSQAARSEFSPRQRPSTQNASTKKQVLNSSQKAALIALLRLARLDMVKCWAAGLRARRSDVICTVKSRNRYLSGIAAVCIAAHM